MTRTHAPSRSSAKRGDRQVLTGLSLVGFALPLFVSDLLDPTKGNLGDPHLDVADATAQPGRLLASTVLLLVSTIFLLLAAANVWRFARTRRRRLTDLGALLVGLGALAHAALVAFNGFLYEMRTGDPAEMAALLGRANEGTVLLLIFPMLLCLAFGLSLLVAVLWRIGVAPLWCFAAVVVSFVLDFFGAPLPGVSYLIYALNLVTFSWLAVIVVRMPATEWESATVPAPPVQTAASLTP